METTRKRRTRRPVEPVDDEVEVRVSTRAPRSKPEPRTPVSRAQTLATGLLEALIGQVADYIETSSAVERLIRTQTRQVLHELARDPEFNALIRTQARQYLAELATHPEILEPLVRAQINLHLTKIESSEKDAPKPQGERAAPKSRRQKPRKAISLE